MTWEGRYLRLTWSAKVKPAEALDFFRECRHIASDPPAPFTIPAHVTKPVFLRDVEIAQSLRYP